MEMPAMTRDALQEAAREAANARVYDDLSMHQAILNALVVLLEHEADKERRRERSR
jgi:hypothetical protein